MVGNRTVTEPDGIWSNKFTAAIVQGATVAGVTVFLVLGQASFVMKAGSREASTT
jgi:hypothetical protein